jgi:hypothetical protein
MGNVSLTEPLENWATSKSISLTLVQGALPVVTYISPMLVGPYMESEEIETESSQEQLHL